MLMVVRFDTGRGMREVVRVEVLAIMCHGDNANWDESIYIVT